MLFSLLRRNAIQRLNAHFVFSGQNRNLYGTGQTIGVDLFQCRESEETCIDLSKMYFLQFGIILNVPKAT